VNACTIVRIGIVAMIWAAWIDCLVNERGAQLAEWMEKRRRNKRPPA
jgi:hypothetical protein